MGRYINPVSSSLGKICTRVISTITYKVVVYAPAEWADTLPLLLLYPNTYSVVILHSPLLPLNTERRHHKIASKLLVQREHVLSEVTGSTAT
jgi:hypothetical protein